MKLAIAVSLSLVFACFVLARPAVAAEARKSGLNAATDRAVALANDDVVAKKDKPKKTKKNPNDNGDDNDDDGNAGGGNDKTQPREAN